MKQPWKMIVLLFFIVGCIRATPYQKMSQGSSCCGYKDQHLKGNIYKVTFTGNVMTARETVTKYAYQRAGEVCKENGYRNYKILSEVQGGNTDEVNAAYDIQSADVELRVECKK